MLSALAVLRDEFLPQWAGIHVYAVLPNLGISGWAIVTLTIGIIAIAEAAFTHHQAVSEISDAKRKRRVIIAGYDPPHDIRRSFLRRYVPPIGSLIAAFLVVQFWPTPVTVALRWPPASGRRLPLPPVNVRSIRDLFDNDYRLLFSASMNRVIVISDGTHWKLEEKVFWYNQDYFVGFWIPHTTRSFEVCEWLSQNYSVAIGDLMSKVSASVGMPGAPLSTLADLKFNGTVVLYHEDDFSQDRKSLLAELFRRNHASLIFRGPLETVRDGIVDLPEGIK